MDRQEAVELVKKAGFSTLKEFAEAIDKRPNTITNWYRKDEVQFLARLHYASETLTYERRREATINCSCGKTYDVRVRTDND